MELESDVSSDEAPPSPGMVLEPLSDVSEDDAPPCTTPCKKSVAKGVKRSVKKAKPDPMLALQDGRITRETLTICKLA
eukprot:2826381-Karenia_brevis.AAC.1